MQAAYGILDYHDIPVFAVDASWPVSRVADDPYALKGHLQANRQRHDFPKLLAFLGGPESATRLPLILQTRIAQLVSGYFFADQP